MDQIKISVTVDESAAIRAGHSRYGTVIVPVDVEALTPEQREELLRCPRRYDRESGAYRVPAAVPDAERYESRGLSLPPISDASPASIATLLDARPMALAAYAELRAKDLEQEVAEVLAYPLAAWASLTSSGTPRWLRTEIAAAVIADPRVIARAAEAAPVVAAAQAAERARKQDEAARATAREAEAEAEVEEFRRWALAHGSETLRLRIELEAGEWVSLADDEYTDAHAPVVGGVRLTRKCWQETGKTSDRRRPQLAELHALAAARELVEAQPDRLSDPELVWSETDDEVDMAGEDITGERYCVLALRVHVPSRGTTLVARRV